VLTWECGKVLRPYGNNNARRFSVNTKKNYVLSMMQSDGKTEVSYDALGSQIGLGFKSERWDVFEGMDFVIRVPGTWRATYHARLREGNLPPLQDAPASFIQSSWHV